MEDKLLGLYNDFKDAGLFKDTKDYGTFRQRMQGQGYQAQIYKVAKQNGADVGQFWQFQRNFGLGRWAGGSHQSTQPSKPLTTAQRAGQVAQEYKKKLQQKSGAYKEGANFLQTNGYEGEGLGDLIGDAWEGVKSVGRKVGDYFDNIGKGIKTTSQGAAPARQIDPSFGAKPSASTNQVVKKWELLQKKDSEMTPYERSLASQMRSRSQQPVRNSNPITQSRITPGAKDYNETMQQLSSDQARQARIKQQHEDDINQMAYQGVGQNLGKDIFAMTDKAIDLAEQSSKDFFKGAEDALGFSRQYDPRVQKSIADAADMKKSTETIQQGLQIGLADKVQEYFSRPEIQKNVMDTADKMNISLDEAIQKYYMPQLMQYAKDAVEQRQLEKVLPQSYFDWLGKNLSNNIVGMLASNALYSKEERQRRQRALAISEGLEEAPQMPGHETKYYKAGILARASGIGLNMLADSPFFGVGGTTADMAVNAGSRILARGLEKVGLKTIGKVLTPREMAFKAANMSMAQKMMSGLTTGTAKSALNLGGYSFITGGLQQISTGEDSSPAAVALAAIESGIHGMKTGAMFGLSGSVMHPWVSKYGITGLERNAEQRFIHGAQKVGATAAGLGVEAGTMMVADHLQDDKEMSFAQWLEDGVTVMAFKLGEPRNYKHVGSILHGLTHNTSKTPITLTKDERNELINSASGKNLMDAFLDISKASRKSPMYKSVYKDFMADPEVSRSTKEKVNAALGMPSQNYKISQRSVNDVKNKQILEYASDGTLLTRTSYKNAEERRDILYRQKTDRDNMHVLNLVGIAKLRGRQLIDDDGKVSRIAADFLQGKGYDINKEPTDPKNAELIANLQNPRHELYLDWIKYADEHNQFTGVDTSINEILKKQPLKRTDEEVAKLKEYSQNLEAQLFPANKLHPEESKNQGRSVAEDNNLGTEQPNGEAVKQELNGLRQAEAEVDALLRDNDVFSQNFKKLQDQGLTNPQIYDWMVQQGGLTVEQLEPFAQYMHANERVQGMQEATKEAIDENVNTRADQWSFHGTINGNKMNGEQVLYVTDKEGRTLIVGSGEVAFDPITGRAKEDVGDMLVCLDTNTRETVYLKAEDVTLSKTQNVEDFKNEDRLRLQMINSQPYNEAAQEQAMLDAAKPQQEQSTAAETRQEYTEIPQQSYTLSDKKAGNGEQFYQDESGNIDLAHVPDEVFDSIGYTKAPFRLTPSMIQHMLARHNKELKFKDENEAIHFVRDVMTNFDHVRLGNDGALVFSIENGRNRTGKRAITILINSDNGEFYGLKTSGYEAMKGLEKRPLLWERGAKNESSSTDAASASVTTSKSPISGEQSGSASHQSIGLDGKDTNNSSNDNENKTTLTFSDGSPVPVDANGEPDFLKMTPQQGAEVYKMLFEEDAEKQIDSDIKTLENDLKKVKASKYEGASVMERAAARKKVKEAIALAEAQVEKAKAIKAAMEKKPEAENTGVGTAENAGQYEKERQQGYREGEGGVIYHRQKAEDVGGIRGNEVTVAFSPTEKVAGHVKLVELDTVQASHNNGQLNLLHFGPDWQPKDRSSQASRVEAEKIAGNIDPEQITGSNNAFIGSAPSVNERHETIQGNNRVEALKVMYANHPEQAAKYKQWLIDHAAEFGLNAEDIKKMKKPVIVNELPVDDATAKKLGQMMASGFESGGKRIPEISATINKLGDKMENLANVLLSEGTLGEDAKLSDLINQNSKRALEFLNKNGFIDNTEYENLATDVVTRRQWLESVLKASLFDGNKKTEAAFNTLPGNAQKAVLATFMRDRNSKDEDRIKQNIQKSFEAYNELNQIAGFKNAKNLEQARAAIQAELLNGSNNVFGEAPIREKYTKFELELAALYKGLKDQKSLTGLFGKFYDAVQGKVGKELDVFSQENAEPLGKDEAIEKVFGINNKQENDRRRETESPSESGGGNGSEPAGDRSAGAERPRVEEPDDLVNKELESRIKVTDEETETPSKYGPIMKQKIVIDGDKEVMKVDEPNEKGEYTGSYYEFDGKKFGDLKEVAEYIDSKQAEGPLSLLPKEENPDPTFDPIAAAAAEFKKEHPLTEEEIMKADVDDLSKDMALDYLNGEVTDDLHRAIYESIFVKTRGQKTEPKTEAPKTEPSADPMEGIKNAAEGFEKEKKAKVKTEKKPQQTADDAAVAASNKKVNDLWDMLKNAGKDEMPTSFIGLNSRQLEVLPKLVSAMAENAYLRIKRGMHNLEDVVKEMRKEFAPAAKLFKKEDVDAIYEQMMNIRYRDGEQRMSLKDWADYYEKISPKHQENLVGDSKTAEDRKQAEKRFIDVVNLQLAFKHKFNGIVELRKIAERLGLKDIKDTDLQELAETAIVKRARGIASSESTNDAEKFKRIKTLYENQPSLNQRDSERVMKQQYSTPAPYAFLADMYVKGNGKVIESALEPSAGNGMLTIGLPMDKVHVNDIDAQRLANLRRQGFKNVTSQDGTQPFADKDVDVVVTNPPFGSATPKEYDGYKISSLEGQMAINALESMKDDGRAAIIIGGKTEYAKNGSLNPKDKAFLGYLYSHYNVEDVINVDGGLYAKQGTSYPTRIILINGRRLNENAFPPVKDKARAETVKDYDELYKRIEDDILRGERMDSSIGGETRSAQPELDKQGSTGAPKERVRAGERGGSKPDGEREPDLFDSTSVSETHDDLENQRGTEPRQDGGLSDGDTGADRTGANVTRSEGTGNNSNSEGRVLESGGNGRSNTQPNADGASESGSGRGPRRQLQRMDQPVRGLSTEKVTYTPKSENPFTLKSVMPADQQEAVNKNLEKLGDADQFLVDELGYNDKDDLYSHLAAEQVDSVALALQQAKKGNAFIVGDQTGIGKGRQAASFIRYAVKNGQIPVYFTQKAHLLSDVYRDLVDIGSPELRPFILGSKKEATVTDSDGNVVYPKPSDAERDRVLDYIEKNGKLPEEYDYVLTTYSQVGNGVYEFDENGARKEKKLAKGKTFGAAALSGQRRRDAIEKLMGNAYLILDESHTAGGNSGQGNYFQHIIQKAKNVTFFSATFAKRPDNMPIYALRTAMNEGGMKSSDLIDAVKRGGATLQEIMSQTLTQCGQMIRRERDMTGVTIDWKAIDDPERVQEQREQYDSIIGLFNDIINFQKKYVSSYVDERNDELAAIQSTMGIKKGTAALGIKNQPFASKAFNTVQQVLLSLKAKSAAERAIDYLKQGMKPVIALNNTNESQTGNFALGEEMDAPDLGTSLKKGLEGTLRYTQKDAKDNSESGYIKLSDLGDEAVEAYHELEKKIEQTSTGLSLSPIDVIKNELQKAGYKVGELTGRQTEFVYNDNGTVTKVKRADTDKKKLARDFNDGKIDALILNKSAATGISLHASSKYKDQKKRVMIVAQQQLDVNDEVQMRGRIDRTGQVARGAYEYVVSLIPAEQRLLMMFKAKLKSLDANTTSSQKSKFNEMEVADITNKYGDKVVREYMAEHLDLYARMADPFGWEKSHGDDLSRIDPQTLVASGGGVGDGEAGADASKLLGRMALLRVSEQEKMLQEIGELYANEIQRLNEMGENDLEITELPLKAKTLHKEVWKQGAEPGGDNAFADNTYIEKVNMAILKKPMKAAEVKASQEGLTGGKTWEEYKAEKKAAVKEYFDKKIADETQKYEERAVKAATKAKEKYIKDAKKGQKDSGMADEQIVKNAGFQYDTIYKQEKDKLNDVIKNLNAKAEMFNRVLDTFDTNDAFVLPTDMNKPNELSGFGNSYGRLIDIKITDNFSPNASTVSFATLDGRRKITFPIAGKVGAGDNKADVISAIDNMTKRAAGFGDKRIRVLSKDFDSWDRLTSNESRKDGYIVTGNLMQALVDSKDQGLGGQLVKYTTDTGEVKTGILMPDRFDPKGLTTDAPINSVTEKFELSSWHGGIDEVTSSDGDVNVKRVDNNRGYYYELRVPKSKAKGGKYFLDEDLLKLVNGNNFETRGNNMLAEFKPEQLKPVLDRLSKMGVKVQEERKTSEDEGTHFRMELGKTFSDTKENFDGVRDRAVEEKGIVMPNLNKESVNVVPVEKHSFKGNNEGAIENARKWAKENLVTTGKSELPTMRDGTPYTISKKAVDKYLSSSAVGKSDDLGVHLSVLPKLTDVIHESIEAEIHPDYNKDENENRSIENGCGDNILVHRLYGAVQLDGKTYRVKTTMQEFRGGEENKPHSYEVTKIELLEGSKTANESDSLPLSSTTNNSKNELLDTPGTAVLPDSSPLDITPSNSISVAKLLNGVEKSYDSGKKLLEESKNLTDEDTYFRNNNESPVSISKDAPAVVKHVAKVAKATGGKVKMLQSIEEVTNSEAKARLEKGEKVEGWYDESTGEVVLYMPNVHDSYTAEKTVWHEIVGHKGMRELFGNDNYDKFLDDIYFNLDKPEYADLKKLVMKELQYNPFNYRNAIEEAIARMAEEGHGEHGLWNNLKNKITNIFREIGYRVAPNTKDIKYLLWLAKNYSKHPESDGFFAMRRNALLHKLEKDNTPSIVERNGIYFDNDGKNHDYLLDLNRKDFEEATDGKVHFRTSPMTASKIEEYDKILGTKTYAFKESTLNHLQALEEAMKLESGEKDVWKDIPSAFNPLQAANRMESVCQQISTRYDRDITKPLAESFERMVSAMDGKNKDEQKRNAELYMITKHGLERNRVLYVRDAIRDLQKDETTKVDAERLHRDWNAEFKDLGDKLDDGTIRFDQFIEKMDEWIRHNIDADYDSEAHDYSGLTAIKKERGKNDPDYSCVDDVMNTEDKMRKELVNEFWKNKTSATDFIIDQEYYNGFKDSEMRNHLKGMFKFYIPLRKFDETTAEDIYGYITEKGDPNNYIGSVIANAKGRESLSDVNVLAQISAMAKTSILNGGKNVVKQHLLRFTQTYANGNNGNRIFLEINPWVEKHTIDGNEVWEEVTPQIPENATQEQISNIVQNFESSMQAKKENGEAKLYNRRGSLGVRFQKASDKNQHIVEVYVAGKKRLLFCQGNPRAAQAVNGLIKDSGASKKWAAKNSAKINRFCARANTSYNIDFMFSNLVRDLTVASANVTKEGPKYTKDFCTEYFNNLTSFRKGKEGNYWSMFSRYKKNKLDMNNSRERMFKEFMDNGGQTGFTEIKKLEDMMKEYDNLIKKGNMEGDPKVWAAIKNGANFIEVANELFENIARYSCYVTSRKEGRSIGRSIYDAKEISGNFNKHGSGDAIKDLKTAKDSKSDVVFRNTLGWFNSYMKNHTMFYNAGVQGASLFARNFKRNIAGTSMVFGVIPFALGIAQALINQYRISNEDEKERGGVKDPYAELPEWKRRNNICIYWGNGKFKTIPIGIELRAFFGLGDIAMGQTIYPNLKSDTPVGYDILGQMAQLVPASDFLGHHSPSGGTVESLTDLGLAAAPTVLKPELELIANRDWTGRPIYRGDDYLNYAPRWKRAYDSTSDVFMDINKWANMTFNDFPDPTEDMKGNDAADFATAPYIYQHLLEGYFGGLGSTTSRIAKTGYKAVTGNFDEIDPNQIPLYRVFNYKPSEGYDMQRTKSKWYNYSDELKQTEYNIKQLKTNTPDVLKNIENNAKKFNFIHGKKGKAYNIWEAADSYITKKKRQLNKASDPEVIKSINEDINRKMQEAVNDLDKLN